MRVEGMENFGVGTFVRSRRFGSYFEAGSGVDLDKPAKNHCVLRFNDVNHVDMGINHASASAMALSED
nr:hypothetical protein Iba_chr03aCG12750 [Ipomoea batatas]